MTHPRSNQPIRVLLVDDHESMLWGLERLIESRSPALTVVGKAATAAEAIALARAVQPDVILLDLDLGSEFSTDAMPDLLSSGARIVILTGVRDRSLRDAAVLAGARGIVGKDEPPATITKAIEKVHEGELWLDRSSTARIFVELSRRTVVAPAEQKKIDRLTPRERGIVRMLAREPGMSIVNIAEKEHISENTLRNHLTSIYAKLGVSNRLELNIYASKNELD